MSALRVLKADLSGGLATALVAVLFASSGIVYAQKNKPTAATPPAHSAPAAASHAAAPAASGSSSSTGLLVGAGSVAVVGAAAVGGAVALRRRGDPTDEPGA